MGVIVIDFVRYFILPLLIVIACVLVANLQQPKNISGGNPVIDKYALTLARNSLNTARDFPAGSQERKYYLNKAMLLTHKIAWEPVTMNVNGELIRTSVNILTGDFSGDSLKGALGETA